MKKIELFARLGQRLEGFGGNARTWEVIRRAVEQNPWFIPQDICDSVEAVRQEMLDPEKLSRWLSRYEIPEHEPKNVAVVMAGNIPLVGFADLLAVICSGNNCLVKFSSKDRVLMKFICDELRELGCGRIAPMSGQLPDAVIATGSDNTNRYFRALYRDIPALLRGSRFSAAVLTPENIAASPSSGPLTLLAEDMFAHSGLGCRSVSLLFLPQGCDPASVFARIARHRDEPNPKYINNYRQQKALLTMEGTEFLDLGTFVAVCSDDLHGAADSFPTALSRIHYTFYQTRGELRKRLAAMDSRLQCVAGGGDLHPRACALGRAQHPGLADYADDMDTMEFLLNL